MTRSPRTVAATLLATATLALAAGCGGGSSGAAAPGTSSAADAQTSAAGGSSAAVGSSAADGSTAAATGPKASISVLIASSGTAETSAVQAAANAWNTKTGNTATVTAAQNMDQQLGQAFAANKAPDVFYLDASKLADYASTGALYAYGDKAAGASDFYPTLKDAFTYKGTFYCAPKDFSTLALEINSAMWTKAGLTAADVPTTWDQLTSVATKLKSALPGVTPLVISTGHDRVDAFLVQAGGNLLDKNGKPTANSAQNITGLTYAKSLLQKGLLQFNTQVGAGWGGEAFGKGKSAMTIEGNWIAGAMSADYKTVKYQVVPLPAGPAGKGTLAFTNCWGIPASSAHKQQAVDFVNAMTAKDQQLAFAKAFGVMPSIQSAAADYAQQFPAFKVFLDGAAYGVGPVKAPKLAAILADYDNQLTKLATLDPKNILSRLQKDLPSSS
ncbi:MAG: multiple sugar transport system substrate-binding protein [Frankiales bacterium]|jgi:multiple sugar transport system substrate-binding protein|nr:multiple sugar transport system substrate-binding protein [Frankiales bacterium]